MKIKKGDTVYIRTGKDKGKSGRVECVLPKEGTVVVEGVNLKKRHQKGRSKNEKGQILEIASPLDISNVALIDPQSKKPTRVGYIVEKDGSKSRVARPSGKKI